MKERMLYVGRAKCCGRVTAAMVDDEQTTANDVAQFARSIAKSNRRLEHMTLTDDTKLSMERCECGKTGRLT
jgi:hypothetical protein